MPQFLETKGIQWYDVTAQSITRLTSASVEAGEVYEKNPCQGRAYHMSRQCYSPIKEVNAVSTMGFAC